MPRRNYEELSLKEMLRKELEAGFSDNNRPISTTTAQDDASDLLPLPMRVKTILGIADNPNRNAGNMLFFVMYDIESNKVRTQVAKYLINQGCTRIQASIFLADTTHEKYDKIREDLAEVQACYENHDSILVVPISTDYLKSMKVIGKNINVDIIMRNRNTLFF
ncbi:MAG: CRISPR-associated endonuclease Cas2 [Bacteroidales bacterium]|nr:CRISPR-associated endonuclease Cas2 [Bacteroidales bacterium]